MMYQAIDLFTDTALHIETEEGQLTAVRSAQPEATASYICPGFFDIQVNGWRGLDYSGPDLDREGILSVVRTLAGAGTTRHLPTIITNTQERICRNLEVIAGARSSSTLLRAAIPGVHIEGPYISPEEGSRGAHDPSFIRAPSAAEYREWQDASGGAVKIVTLAPEQPGSIRFIEELAADGVVPAIGHTGADPETVRKAVAAGAKLSTHLGNGSPDILPRLSNFLWEQLACDSLHASIISDGFHLPASVIRVMERSKGRERLILISDASPIGGLTPGEHNWGNMNVEVEENGRLGLAGTPYLAGAGHLLDWDIIHFMQAAGVTLKEAVTLAAINPRRFLGTAAVEGGAVSSIEASDFILFEYAQDLPRLSVKAAFLEGIDLSTV
jgi:N-acetylglucosamine-6-phosphate deacetylase